MVTTHAGLMGIWAILCGAFVSSAAEPPAAAPDVAATGPTADLLAGRFKWVSSGPLLAAAPKTDESVAIKDPTIVWANDRWHIYATIKQEKLTCMEYLTFDDWKSADAAPRQVIKLVDSYHCAPQVFYFAPQKKWYLIYQWADKTPGTGFFGPCYSTIEDVGKPKTLTQPVMLFDKKVVDKWIDFWVICDESHAYLFFTGDDGKFWRSRTPLADFPKGWSRPELVLQDKTNEFFEASHTYRLKGMDKYLTIVEAIGPAGKRYYKSYLADRLDAPWKPAAGAWDKPFASIDNVTFAEGAAAWTDSISHGELLREGNDQMMIVDPAHLRLLYQGCTAAERAGKGYGKYPWRLGILEPAQ